MKDKKIEIIKLLKYGVYFFGVPMFFLAVIIFAATSVFQLDAYTVTKIKQGAMPGVSKAYYYPVWVALALFLIMIASHIAIALTVKNSRIKAFSMTAVVFVVMLIPLVAIDGAYKSKISKIQNEYTNIGFANYEKHLGYVRPRTTAGAKNYIREFQEKLKRFEGQYNLLRYPQNESNIVGGFGNQPLTYYDFGIDYDGDGVLKPAIGSNKNDAVMIDVKPQNANYNKKGDLVKGKKQPWLKFEWNGTTYEDKDVEVTQNGKTYRYVRKSFLPKWENGKYGYALYYKNGELADGYIYSVEVALNILEKYHKAKEVVDGNTPLNKEELIENARLRRQQDYENKGLSDIYERETGRVLDKYTLNDEKLDKVIGILIATLAELKLPDDLLQMLNMNGNSNLIAKIKDGVLIKEIPSLLPSVLDGVLPKSTITKILEKLGLEDVKLTIKKEINPANTSNQNPQLHLILEDPNNKWNANVFLDETITLGKLNEGLNKLLDNVLRGFGIEKIVGTVSGLLGNLPIKFYSKEEMANGKYLDIPGTVKGILQIVYAYRSPILKPLTDYYVDPEADELLQQIQKSYADLDAAMAEGGARGFQKGSTLIPGSSFLAGKKLGAGDVEKTLINSLKDVQLFKAELKILPEMYPMIVLREMLMVFISIAILATFLACVFSQEEKKWIAAINNGTRKKDKKSNKAESEEDVQLNSDLFSTGGTNA